MLPLLEKMFPMLRGNRPTKEELLAAQVPSAGVNVNKALLSFIQYAEAKQILDHILQARREKNFKTIALLSEFPKEGKTVLASALALGFGELLNQKVLVVDCTTVTGTHSLSLDRLLEPDDLAPKAPPTVLKKTLAVTVATLSFKEWAQNKPAGIAEYQIQDLIKEYTNQFDLILFDTCAMSAKNRNNFDPIAIARRCDSSILVVSRRSANRSNYQTIRDRLEKEKLELLGVVGNEGVIV